MAQQHCLAFASDGNAPNGAVCRTLVVGVGMTGLSCGRFLARQNCPVAFVDSRANPPALESLREAISNPSLRLGGFDPASLDGIDRLVVSPGVPLDEPLLEQARRRGLPVLGDIDLFVEQARAPIIAITGSNGKSTVTSLLAQLLSAAGHEVRAGGNLGPPALDLLHDDDPDYYALELSSFQLERTARVPCAAAVVLNVSADHLDRYADIESYAEAKARLYRDARRAVVNRDDPWVSAMATLDDQPVSFGLDAPAAGHYGLVQDREAYLAFGDERIAAVSELRILGRHNAANALAALALGHAAGCAHDAMLAGLRQFRGLPHRTEWVAEIAGVRWINDSKATNLGATLVALEAIPGRVVLIAGGDAKGADLAPLHAPLKQKARAAVLYGQDAGLIETVIAAACPSRRVATLEDAVLEAAALAQSGDSVMLSPACSSLDMFADYRERGDRFVRAVRELDL